MQTLNDNALQALDSSIKKIVGNIDKYKKHPQDFTRNRKFTPESLLKTMLNMQGNSLNAELLEAFPNMDERMTASAYEQARDKLDKNIFKYLMTEFNQTAPKPKKLLNGKYRMYAVDGSDFTPPYNPESAFVMPANKRNGKESKPFCQVHANIMFDQLGRQYVDCVLEPRSEVDERVAALKMIAALPKDNHFIVTMDRATRASTSSKL